MNFDDIWTQVSREELLTQIREWKHRAALLELVLALAEDADQRLPRSDLLKQADLSTAELEDGVRQLLDGKVLVAEEGDWLRIGDAEDFLRHMAHCCGYAATLLERVSALANCIARDETEQEKTE